MVPLPAAAASSLRGARHVCLQPLSAASVDVALEAFRPAHRQVRASWRLAGRADPVGAATRGALAVPASADQRSRLDALAALLEELGEPPAEQVVLQRADARPDGRDVAVVGAPGRPRLVVKVGTTSGAVPRLVAETTALRALTELGLGSVAPEVRAADPAGGWLVTRWVTGEAVLSPRLGPPHAALLGRLATVPSAAPGDCGDQLAATAAAAERLPAPLPHVPAALRQAADGLAGAALVHAHGDLVPWNLRARPDGSLVAVDWETSGPRPPLWDAVHWCSAVAVHWGRGSSSTRARRLLASRTWHDARSLAAGQGLDAPAFRAAALACVAGAAVELVQRYGGTRLGHHLDVRLHLLELLLAGR